MQKKFLLKGLLTSSLLMMSLLTFAQQKVGSNPGALNPSAVFELESPNKGFLPPRVALTSTAVWGLSGSATAAATFGGQTSAADGMIIYNTATAGTAPNNVTPGFYVWNGGAAGSWKRMTVVSGVNETNGLALDANGVLSYTPSAITGANVTAGSSKVTLGGTPTGAALKAFSVDVNEANLNLANVGGTLPIAKITPAGTAGQVLTSTGTGTAPTWQAIPAVTNIYNTNGTLTSARTVTLSTNNLTFDASSSGQLIVSGPIGNTAGLRLSNLTGAGNAAAAGQKILTVNASGDVVLGTDFGTANAGTVTSVALSLPSIFTVAGSPVTASGTLSATLATQQPNFIWAGPASGTTNAVPTFRALTFADLPAIPATELAGTGSTAGQVLVSTGAGTAPVWQNLPVSAVTGAANGLSLLSGNVELGGALTKNTTITTSATNFLTLAGLQAKTIQNDGNDSLLVVNANGQLRYRAAIGISPVQSVTSGNGLTLSGGVLSMAPTTAAEITSGANVTAGSTKVTLGGTPTGAALKAFSVDVNEANLNLTNIGGTLPIAKITPAGTAGQVLTSTGVGTAPTWQAVPAATNIYNANGTLTGNRLVTMGTNGLTFSGSGLYAINTKAVVGNATSNSSSQLQVVSDSGSPFILEADNYGTDGAGIRIRNARGTVTAPVGTFVGNNVGYIRWAGHNGTSFTSSVANIGVIADESFTSTSTGASLVFNTVPIGSVGDVIIPERMRINSEGNVGIGTIAPNSILHVNGAIATAIVKTSSALTLTNSHRTVLANAFAGGFVVTLPAPSTCAGREYIIRKTDESSNAITFTFAGIIGSNAIRVSDTSATAGAYINSLNYVKTLRIQSDGTDWYLID